MASYRSRLERDLDGWIGAGLVPADSREPILATVPEDRRLDAATAGRPSAPSWPARR